MPVIPAIQEAEAQELLELGRWRLQWAQIMPLHSSLSDKMRHCLKRKKKSSKWFVYINFYWTLWINESLATIQVMFIQEQQNLRLKWWALFFNMHYLHLLPSVLCGRPKALYSQWYLAHDRRYSKFSFWNHWHNLTCLKLFFVWAWWLMLVFLTLWEAQAGRSCEVMSLSPAWPTCWNIISTKITKLARRGGSSL